MRTSYYTNFIINSKNDEVVLAIDYDSRHESLAGAMEYHVDDEFHVQRVGPLSDSPLYETPGEWEPEAIRSRVSY